MRQMLLAHKDVLLKVEKLQKKAIEHDGDLKVIFDYLKELLNPKIQAFRKTGFRRKEDI